MNYGKSRRIFGIALFVLLVGTAGEAFAARSAATEVGEWLGFAHTAGSPGPGAQVSLILVANPATNALALQGTISGLPAVQNQLNVAGSVGLDGAIILVLKDPSTGDRVGFCDGSVMPIKNFGDGSGQDDLGSLTFSATGPTGAAVSGHINLLHMFGGSKWQQAGINWGDFGGFPPDPCAGGFVRPSGDVANDASLDGMQEAGSVGVGGPNLDSAFYGEMKLSLVPFEMVGTVNNRGSIVMMCDGSIPGANTSLIGLLFTGGVRVGLWGAGEHVTDIVGNVGGGPFATFLPAVQSNRTGAMSFFWLVPAVAPTP